MLQFAMELSMNVYIHQVHGPSGPSRVRMMDRFQFIFSIAKLIVIEYSSNEEIGYKRCLR